MAHDIFISYAIEDKPVADAVCATLESHSMRCWIAPRDVLPGKPYPEAIEDAVTTARLMVVVFSQHATQSAAVRSEIHLGFSRELTMIPFRLQNVPLVKGMNFLLGVVHWLDAMFEGILWILRTGAPWEDVPKQYASGSTCWRRLRDWEEQDLWLDLWRAFLADLDQRGQLDWSECFIDGSFAPAKKGANAWERPKKARERSGWWWSTATRCSSGKPPGLGVPGGSQACRKNETVAQLPGT
jgi:hypothetical protein